MILLSDFSAVATGKTILWLSFHFLVQLPSSVNLSSLKGKKCSLERKFFVKERDECSWKVRQIQLTSLASLVTPLICFLGLCRWTDKRKEKSSYCCSFVRGGKCSTTFTSAGTARTSIEMATASRIASSWFVAYFIFTELLLMFLFNLFPEMWSY